VLQNARVQLFLVEQGMLHHVGGTGLNEEQRARLKALYPARIDQTGYNGTAILEKRTIHVADVMGDSGRSEITKATHEATGLRAILVVPMISEGEAIGSITTSFTEPGEFTDKQIALLNSFAAQAVIAIRNARLFREIQDKSRQLEIANQHKSDFLANMSHELRTPLNAIIGFSEVLLEKMFGEVNDKQLDYLQDIHSSGKHLLSLINDILDLSKIEAGRMELDVADFDLRSALENAITLVKERAQRHGIALGLDVDPSLGNFRGDERKFKQILLNLLSNAVKFTPEGGKVDVVARPGANAIEFSVSDTGVGIAASDQELVFEEFKQVGTDYTRKAEGTGLGLALTRRFVELHGGKIWLASEPGKGSTFTFTIPLGL
jgi:signal transduction histidine kinase